MQPNINLCTGYRKTGKDSLYQELIGNRKYTWYVYCNQNLHKNYNFSLFNETIRIGFADKLKEEASLKYNIPLHISDEDKDKKIYVHPKTKQLVSARDIYIEWGKKRRNEDINYWVKKVEEQFVPEYNNIITDWRFINEYEYLNERYPFITTIRLFRSDVPIPNYDIESEHNLDTFETDYLFLATPNDFDIALELFPQYSNFKYLFKI